MRRELRWIIPALVVVAMEYALALAIGIFAGFQFALPTKSYAILTSTIAASALILIVVGRLAYFATKKVQHPARRLAADAKLHSAWLISICFAFVLVGLQIGALTWLKVMLPIAAGFWADPLLADTERMLLGHDAWVISHALFGGATKLLDRVYVSWMPVKLITLIFVILAPLSFRRARSLLSYFFIMATGSFSQYLAPSGGPVFYERLGFGSRFDDLPVEPWVATARDYLWADYLQPQSAIGAGISAMPSMHVAIALWVALVLQSYSRGLRWIGWAWFAAIFVGSIHLGWHYALDSIVATAIGFVGYHLADKLLTRPDRDFYPAPLPAAN